MNTEQPKLSIKKNKGKHVLLPVSLTITTICFVIIGICLFIDRINSQKWKLRPTQKLSQTNLKTGDILLFSGRSFKTVMPTISFVIKLVSNSDISHVGIVWRDPVTGIPWVWHTAGVIKTWKNLIPKDPARFAYAHLLSIEDAINPSYGNVYLRPCSHELNSWRMAEFIRTNLGRDYSFDVALHTYNRTLGVAPLNFLEANEAVSGVSNAINARWSCAELLVHTLCFMGIMSPGELQTAHSYLPKDFSSVQFLKLQGPISYGPEIRLIKELKK
jgi:hypothetical protein